MRLLESLPLASKKLLGCHENAALLFLSAVMPRAWNA
jgi:hypothetical protein